MALTREQWPHAPMGRNEWRALVIAVLLAGIAFLPSALRSDPTFRDRLRASSAALDEHLTEDAARREARRVVWRCQTEDHLLYDAFDFSFPVDARRFDSLDAATTADAGQRGRMWVNLADEACSRDQLDAIRNSMNI